MIAKLNTNFFELKNVCTYFEKNCYKLMLLNMFINYYKKITSNAISFTHNSIFIIIDKI